MNMLRHLNSAIGYIEKNLCDEINLEEAAKIACVTSDSFLRFFSYMTGMTLNEYIRRRRLSLVIYDLQQSNEKIINIALKYGYDSTDAFSRAFKKQHGVTPSAFRRFGGSAKVYPPASFQIIIKGAKEMDFRIIDIKETIVYGVSKEYDTKKYSTREALRHSMWDEKCDSVPGKISNGKWNQPQNQAFDGVWYGVWQDGKYMIARERANINNDNLEEATITKGKYAAFTTDRGCRAWEELPKLFELIFDSWLPSSEYELRNSDIVEVYHLWTDYDMRKKNRYFEIWIPITKK